MPRKICRAGEAQDPSRTLELRALEMKLDEIVSRLLDDPTNTELNSERLRIEIKIITITGEPPLDSINF